MFSVCGFDSRNLFFQNRKKIMPGTKEGGCRA
jgi:hypothetical protein